ncbi:family 78 glycoside hydrolase catalytic domain [Horticoccus sp. 23ND18S-11]|uniref:family 78 glycoside hydrolase catalytic domain n=1 Tax=Horticoccus sp. 23ND18S-11 TaxID=3391832 RepID=UPI0039C9ABBE
MTPSSLLRFSKLASALLVSVFLFAGAARTFAQPAPAGVTIAALRCEYLESPDTIDATAPRLSWRLESARRGAAQTAWQIRVASTAAKLAAGEGDLWDSGRVAGSATNQIAYAGRALASRAECFWQVRIWDDQNQASGWSAPARWAMGLLSPADWNAEWIAHRDESPLHTDRKTLHLPAPRHFRRDFTASKPVRRAVVYASALGLYDLYCNGRRVGDAFFQPGWSDYLKRAYYRGHDVTALVRSGGPNAIGAIVAEGWYSGYVGYGLLVGYGPNQVGRYFYGKTPALRAQLEIDFVDGTRETIGTDASWRVTERGPTREADLIMGEAYDARAELGDWSALGFDAKAWETAVPAGANPRLKALYSDAGGRREVDLGFVPPAIMQAYSAPPIRVTQELPARRMSEPKPGVYVFDLGQNFAGVVRLKVRGAAGTRVQLRFGEMLHRDGMIMTENLRRARATDFYTLRGDPAGETWSPRFTYHGFQYVEITGLAAAPGLDAVTGLVLHNDTPLTGGFECSDPILTQFGRNAQWTQRANFVEIPTDCPQRDERLGWMGDAQAYVRTASFNADVAAFFTKWIDDVGEAQRSFGAYPDYAPYPMTHGSAGKSFGTGWTDAGIICPWTIWQTYGDTRLIERHWNSMTRFMEWRHASTTVEGLGTSLGNPWGDWLNVKEDTPVEFIDTCYHALDCTLMAEMAAAIGRPVEAANYRARRAKTQAAFTKAYRKADGTLNVATQSAYVLALWVGLVPEKDVPAATAALVARIAGNDHRMATGFLGTRSLLPALSAHGQHDLATRLFQSRKFPSWGYEVSNGANSVWERWDSYTAEHGFNGANGNQNAAMNSFSHYAFGAVMEWAYRVLAGIDTDGAGYRRIVIRPRPPAPGSNPDQTPICWVKAHYDSINGRIASAWKLEGGAFTLEVTIPANTSAVVVLPKATAERTTESGAPLASATIAGVRTITPDGEALRVEVGAGSYRFVVRAAE